MIKLLIILFFLSPFPAKAQIFSLVSYVYVHNNYYVSSSGNNSNNGTSPATPWQTIAKVNATPLFPGDTVHFKGGETFAGNLIIQNSGTISSRIVIKNYGTGRPQINCTDGNGIKILNAEYVTVDSMYVQGSGIDTTDGAYTSTGYGIGCTSTQLSGTRYKGNIIKNSIVKGCRLGILIEKNAGIWPQTTYRGYDSTVIYGNDVSLCGHTGIFVWAASDTHASDPAGFYYYSAVRNVDTNIIIQRNNVHDMFGFLSATLGLNNYGTGIRIESADGGTIEYNRCDNCGHCGSANGYPANFESEVSRNITWQYNESSRCKYRGTSFADCAGFDVFDGGTSGMLVQFNYIHDNDGYGIGGGGVGGIDPSNGVFDHIARFNILVNNSVLGLVGDVTCWGPYYNYKFYNNTVYSSLNGNYLVLIQSPIQSSYFTNNIFITTGTRSLLLCPTATDLPTLVNNLYYRGGSNLELTIGATTYNTLAALHAAGYEKVSGTDYGVTGAPLFVNAGAHADFLPGADVATMTDYNLQNGSAAKNAGIPMLTIVGFNEGTKDFHLTTFVNIINIGAVQ